ncbi:RagB/SusD family nutrient uptake outer membrane protein, partial [Streptococcus suis]
TNKSGRLLAEAQNVLGAHFTNAIWTNNYASINQINNTINAINTASLSPAITSTEQNRWLGQLLFLRGLHYFDLARVYGYIPGAVVTSQDKGCG